MPTLDWIGKKAVVNHHRDVSYRLIHCDKDKSVGDPDAGNLLVQGDNLEALKALLPYYAGKVKCIYIDPPFNTGSEDWIYNDNVNSPEIRAWLGSVVKKESEDLTRHDKWLCMMYPRLILLREFMSEGGTLFFHIDDNELGNSILLCDEIFSRKNRINVVTFKQASATGHKSINPGFVTVTNNLIVYAKNRAEWSPNRVFTGRERDTRYNGWISNRDAPHGEWRITTLMNGFASNRGLTLKEARTIAKDDPAELDRFVLENASSVIQPARPDYNNVGQETRNAIDRSRENPNDIIKVAREGYSDIYLKDGQRILFYSDKIKMVDGQAVSGEPLTTLWDDILSNNIHKEGGVDFPKGKKPEALIKRCFELATAPGDLVMDSFAGSGTTAAVAIKMRLRCVTIEMGDHASTHTAPRLKAVVEGADTGGISTDVGWRGGSGFRFCTLGEPLFDADGNVSPAVTYPDLAAHVFFCETGSPIPRRADGSSTLIGTFQGRAIYLLHSAEAIGVASAKAGNVLTASVLESLRLPEPGFTGARVVYAEGCTVPDDRLSRLGVTFKQVPYQIEGL
ncbi:MAG: site-specific DNA-methyltransferase [Rhizobiaceae bacterium]|nr:site-specific DNA-methyltransferase [Rhizobiaceae bacterium]